jgi:hypothetical protein
VRAREQEGIYLILRAGRDDVELVTLGDFSRLPSETMDEMKGRIQQKNHAGLLVVAARGWSAGQAIETETVASENSHSEDVAHQSPPIV